MIFGTPHIVDDEAEKLRALERFIEGLFPGRWDTLREARPAGPVLEVEGLTMMDEAGIARLDGVSLRVVSHQGGSRQVRQYRA